MESCDRLDLSCLAPAPRQLRDLRLPGTPRLVLDTPQSSRISSPPLWMQDGTQVFRAPPLVQWQQDVGIGPAKLTLTLVVVLVLEKPRIAEPVSTHSPLLPGGWWAQAGLAEVRSHVPVLALVEPRACPDNVCSRFGFFSSNTPSKTGCPPRSRGPVSAR